MTERELERAFGWCRQQCSRLLAELDREEDEPKKTARDEDEAVDDYAPVDGAALEEAAAIDVEDDTLLLALWQRLRGPLLAPGTREPLVYEHVLVDEAQDLSPVELSIVLGCTSSAQSITLAGDVAQRLHMDNGFRGWDAAMSELGLSHVQIEPLRLSYRSTTEIVEFSRSVLGHLADDNAPEAVRAGAPVELFRFAESGEAVAFLADALRELMANEPRASVAVVARHPEQADVYYHGLHRAETTRLRRIAHQDFPFRPGIDVTDIRQVKGLEFDYVVLVDVSEATYALDDEARHLLHIGATRAAHQLWIMTSGKPSPLLPQELRDRSI
jgi:DNA helicase-2/ATP-dependent DNA helicase PcrA